tara:strand:+ start:2455 stop:3246 length:792 start_codon:yes stop_codon:yes gene_type:complete
MKELQIRLISGFIYSFIVLFSIFYSYKTFYLLILFFSLLSIWEFQRLIDFFNPFPVIILSILVFLNYNKLIPEPIIFIISAICIIANSITMILLYSNKKINYSKLNKIFFLIFYLCFSCFLLIQIPFVKNDYIPEYIAFYYIVIWSNNSFAYLFGKKFGEKKLMPHISPKKTWEGFLSGIIITTLLSYMINLNISLFNTETLLFLSVSICILATIGDLVESYFKRIAKVKDSGSLIPGHGGFYDRMDSVIFAAPFYYLLLKFI